jgi:hypothetical protein
MAGDWDGWAVYRVEDKSGAFLWWEVSARAADGTRASFSDFRDGDYLGLSETDKARSKKRVAKVN